MKYRLLSVLSLIVLGGVLSCSALAETSGQGDGASQLVGFSISLVGGACSPTGISFAGISQNALLTSYPAPADGKLTEKLNCSGTSCWTPNPIAVNLNQAVGISLVGLTFNPSQTAVSQCCSGGVTIKSGLITSTTKSVSVTCTGVADNCNYATCSYKVN